MITLIVMLCFTICNQKGDKIRQPEHTWVTKSFCDYIPSFNTNNNNIPSVVGMTTKKIKNESIVIRRASATTIKSLRTGMAKALDISYFSK